MEEIEWPKIGMTFDETARALRIESTALRDAIQNRGFPARRIGRGWRIDPDAAKAWLAQGEFTPRTRKQKAALAKREAAKAVPPDEPDDIFIS